MTQGPAQHIVRGQAAKGESTAMEINQHRQLRACGRIKPNGHGMAVARRNRKTVHLVQLGRRNFQYRCAYFVGKACLSGRERMQRHLGRARHAVKHTVHGGSQQGAGITGVAHGLGVRWWVAIIEARAYANGRRRPTRWQAGSCYSRFINSDRKTLWHSSTM